MALVKHGSGIVAISGKQGGQYFHRDRFGSHVKKLPTRNRKCSSLQKSVRNAYRSCSSFYFHGTLSQSDIDKWTLFASNNPKKNSLGQVRFWQPIHHFLFFNMPRVLNNLAIISEPPTVN